ncbi:MAG: hypothetical protein D6762_05945 [Candidatus Neomarinimicrobiota bacterium]|nr:MAG: hypothetical protein D6762_05945 [Candidatus Neomarinimicrobiota bacterium]
MNPTSDAYLILDLGTSSSKVFVVDAGENILFRDRRKHHLYRPAPHHVEAHPTAILDRVRDLIQSAGRWARDRGLHLSQAGLACQRSTFLFWDRITGAPQGPALSWQDSRATDIVAALETRRREIQSRTGIPLSAHFGGPKYLHLIRHEAELRAGIDAQRFIFGPLSAFVVYHLTGVLAVDETIAGRTLLFHLDRRRWDPDLLNWFQIDESVLPPLAPTLTDWGVLDTETGAVPLRCVIGDQQAALLGQGTSLALNFGTSGSVQVHTGSTAKHVPGLLSNVLVSRGDECHYFLEGTINACNSLFYWLEDEFHLPHRDMQWHRRAAATSTTGILVPGFVGLAAPYWQDQFQTIFWHLDPDNLDEVVRAGMESIGFLTADILAAMAVDLPDHPLPAGGGGARPPLLQFLADLLDHPVGHTVQKDKTALGVLRCLTNPSLADISREKASLHPLYHPRQSKAWRQEKIQNWRRALSRAGILPRLAAERGSEGFGLNQ